jgi:hypothetical protein
MPKIFSFFVASRYESTWRNAVVSITAWSSAILFCLTVRFLLTNKLADSQAAKDEAFPFLLLWAVFPPVWFWAEHHLIWATATKDERGDFDEFKHSQELGRNIWLALLGIIVGLYFHK